jgi:CRISPR-associated DxTHG motif protein
MRKIITFLGMQSSLTRYQQGAQVYEGEVFPQAVRQFETFDQMLVCLTAGARSRTWHLLENLQDDRIIPIDIPDGRNEAEIWQTFEAVIQHIDQNDDVIFDITHGLRSLPFQVFLFAAYLKAAKNAAIKAIYYGAFDLKDSNGIAPVIDLSGFVTMLDWLSATDRFTHLGDGQALADLIRAPMPTEREMKQVPAVKKMGQQLQKAADAIDTISLALAVTRPKEVIQASADLNQAVDAAEKILDAKVKPFALVQAQVQAAYGQFATASDAPREHLQKQFDMIGWYIDRQQVVQASTLLREWLVSVYCWKLNISISNRNCREDVGQAFNNIGRSSIKKESPYDRRMSQLSEQEYVGSVWNKTIQLRNDIAHCGMIKDSNKNQRTAANLKQEMESLYNEISKNLSQLIEHSLE